MRVEHFMTKNPVTCDVTTPIRDVARLMHDKGVGCVVVLRNGRLAGLVTDRALAVDALASDMPGETAVEDLLPKDRHPAAVGVDDNVFAVLDTMRSAGVVRRVPVITPEAEVVGIVSLSDIAVIAKDMLDGILLEETHNALNNAHVLTGGKRIVKDIRRPTKMDRLPPEQPTHAVTTPTPQGNVPASGGAGRPQRREGQGKR